MDKRWEPVAVARQILHSQAVEWRKTPWGTVHRLATPSEGAEWPGGLASGLRLILLNAPKPEGQAARDRGTDPHPDWALGLEAAFFGHDKEELRMYRGWALEPASLDDEVHWPYWCAPRLKARKSSHPPVPVVPQLLHQIVTAVTMGGLSTYRDLPVDADRLIQTLLTGESQPDEWQVQEPVAWALLDGVSALGRELRSTPTLETHGRVGGTVVQRLIDGLEPLFKAVVMPKLPTTGRFIDGLAETPYFKPLPQPNRLLLAAWLLEAIEFPDHERAVSHPPAMDDADQNQRLWQKMEKRHKRWREKQAAPAQDTPSRPAWAPRLTPFDESAGNLAGSWRDEWVFWTSKNREPGADRETVCRLVAQRGGRCWSFKEKAQRGRTRKRSEMNETPVSELITLATAPGRAEWAVHHALEEIRTEFG